MTRILLSAPDVRDVELEYVQAAIGSNWIAPAGPDLNQFEVDLAAETGREFCVGLSSGTAALHLALLTAGVGVGDVVFCSSLTFVASANAIHYVGAEPVFLDSECETWNLDPAILAEALAEAAIEHRLPAAVVAVDLYGQCAQYEIIQDLCDRYGVPLIEDAAEALGASHNGRPAGSFGTSSILSFNGNKIITASGGGALLTDDGVIAKRAKYLSTQAREPVLHYEHLEPGYNYRLSNLLAAFGRGQLARLDDRVARRREINDRYRQVFKGIEGVRFIEERAGDTCTFWLTAIVLDPGTAPMTSRKLIQHLDGYDIESRPVWKPMHIQPAYRSCRSYLNGVSESLFENGVCLPSGSGMSDADLSRVLTTIDMVLPAS